MTTKKNLVNKMFMNILTAGIFGFVFTACSDDVINNNEQAQAVAEITASASGLKNLPNAEYSFP